MPAVAPFHALQYRSGRGDVSRYIAPPYDVLDAAGKARLLAVEPRNIVAIDLPHTPAKDLGPPEAYRGAADTLRSWRADGTLSRRAGPAMFAYRQSFQFMGRDYQRCGMACTVAALPFGPRAGGGVLPHEQTFSGPKEDRLALMKATGAQLSPIFGLYADTSGVGTAVVREIMATRPADMTARMDDGWSHEVWTVADAAAQSRFAAALAGQDVFIADGHHRYTTGLNYRRYLEESGVPMGPAHPAARSMMVLVGMSDPGLAIGPTHRVLGGMPSYSLESFTRAAAGLLNLTPVAGGLRELDAALQKPGAPDTTLGLYDFATGRSFLAAPARPDPLAERFPAKPAAWRTLAVALVQHLVVERVCEPALCGGVPVKWAFPHTVAEVDAIGKGAETGSGGGAGFAQLAVLVRPTPLDAVRQVSLANELMPQKSTFFYPKLATGLFIHAFDA